MELRGKTILLTGASSGIGEALAEELANFDCKLILIARRLDKLSELKIRLNNSKAQIEICRCDVSDKKQVASLARELITTYKFIDIVILNAGAGHRVIPEEFNSLYAEEIFGANLFGIIYWVESLLPLYLKEKKGMIVGVSSMADNRGYSGSGFYSASKAAASIFLEGLRIELDSYNVKVLTVRPGFVKTPMTDKNEFEMPFLMQPGRAAKIITNGIIKEKRIIQFPLQMVWITNLIGLLPGRLYEFFARMQYRKMRKQDEN
jgi:short-subunit dehydrogenase